MSDLHKNDPIDRLEVEQLTNLLIDGQLDHDGEGRLASLLKQSAMAREVYRKSMALHGSLLTEEVVAGSDWPEHKPVFSSLSQPQAVHRQETPRRAMVAAASLTIAAIVVAAAATGWTGWRRVPSAAGPIIAQVESVNGAALWYPEEAAPMVVSDGMDLTAGRFRLEGSFGHVAFRFLDGTSCYLCDETELSLADKRGKQLILHRGVISIDAAPQPPGQPLVLTTPESRVEVLGTSFVVESRESRTRVAVDEGEVSMRPLGEGATVQVTPGTEATGDVVQSWVRPLARPAAVFNERTISFAESPVELGWGNWRTDADWGGRARAQSFVAARLPGQTPIVHSGVSLNFIAADLPLTPVVSDAAVRLRLRSAAGESLDCRLMLGLAYEDGRFAGNFEHHFNLKPKLADGWQTVEIPLAACKPLTAGQENLTEAKLLKRLLVATWLPRSTLEVAEVALCRSPAARPDRGL